jgi:hypothetical protein
MHNKGLVCVHVNEANAAVHEALICGLSACA